MTDSTPVKAEELTSDELDRAVGGIIPQLYRQTSAFERVALNPQPLPPRLFLFGR